MEGGGAVHKMLTAVCVQEVGSLLLLTNASQNFQIFLRAPLPASHLSQNEIEIPQPNLLGAKTNC